MSKEFLTRGLRPQSSARSAASPACPPQWSRRRQWPWTWQRPPLPGVLSMALTALGSWLILSISLPHLPHIARDYSLPVRAQVMEARLDRGQGLFSLGGEQTFVYHYIHQGQLFRASTYRPGGHLDEAIRAHPAGSMLTVYLDPEAPRFSMVWPGLTRGQIGDLGLGVALILLGVGSRLPQFPPWRVGARS